MKCRPPTRPVSFGTMMWASWSEIEALSLTRLLWKFHVRGDPQTCYGLFLPFSFNDGKPHSLTVFCSPDGLCCIQVDDDPKQRLGAPHKRSSAITFYLEPNETIKSFYLITRRTLERILLQGPFLLAKTSTGRCLYYDFYIFPALEVTGAHVSTYSLNNESASVVGIFADTATANTLLLRTLGVITEPNGKKVGTDPESTVNSIKIPVLTHIERDSFAGLYLETAMVDKATFALCVCVKMQKRGSRCIGLLAQIGSATIILGQWDPSQVNCICKLYSQKDDVPLECITFIFSDGARTSRYVEDIILNDTNRTERSFVWDNLNKDLAWYLTSEYDHLGYWDGASLQMNAGKSDLPSFPVVN
ncbi:hypothetical protein V2G26_003346 [Clonostachys chloroleuca]